MKRNITGYVLLLIFVGAMWHLVTNIVVSKPEAIRELDAEIKFQQEKLISAQILASELNRVSSLIDRNLADSKQDERTEEASLDFLNSMVERLNKLGAEITLMKALPRERNIRGYIRTPYFVGFTGSYTQFGQFLNALEQDSRMAVVEYFKIDNNLTRLNFAKTFDDLKKHDFEIKVSTLTLVKSEAGSRTSARQFVKTYSQLFWNLLILLFLLGLAWGGFQAWELRDEVKRIEDAPRTEVGSDKRLRKTVDDLELRLQERSDFVFESRNNPLDISRVIISKNIMMDERNFLAALEKKPRLSCIIQGEVPRAIIRLKNKNHVVTSGDKFEGYQVAWISEDEVRLQKGGRNLDLQVEAASKDLAKRLSNLNFEF